MTRSTQVQGFLENQPLYKDPDIILMRILDNVEFLMEFVLVSLRIVIDGGATDRPQRGPQELVHDKFRCSRIATRGE